MTNAIAAKYQSLVTSSDALVMEKLAEYAIIADGAFAENTIKAIASDTAHFSDWCSSRNVSACPANPKTIAGYIEEMAGTYASSTISRRLSSIGHLHRAAGVDDPTKSEVVKLAKRRMRRAHPSRPRQAHGLTEHDVSAILATTGSTLVDLRDIALLLTARDLLARRSELTSLRVDSLTFNDDGSATVLIERSKTDQEGEGTVMWLSPRAASAVLNWLDAADIDEGYLFRSLRRGGRVCGHLSDRGVSVIFKAMAERAGIDPKSVSGHSCRVGMAQDLAVTGAALPELMTAGRWKSPQMPARYTERTSAARGAVAKYHEKRGG